MKCVFWAITLLLCAEKWQRCAEANYLLKCHCLLVTVELMHHHT